MLEILSILLFVLAILLIAYIFYLRRERNVIVREIDVRVKEKFMKIKDAFRQEVLKSSRAGLKGRIGEQIVPFLEQFRYNPSDARFIGSPIDYIIFDGYTEVKDRNAKQPITVVLADIKTGKSASLTREQRRIKKAIEEKCVKWETITLR